MSALKEIQDEFQDYLVTGNEAILPGVAKDERFSATKRLQVYFNAYRIRLLEILKLDFPKTHTMLGDEGFEEVFFPYLKAHTSQHFSVRYFGQHFSQFLAKTKPFSDYPVFAEMALFEWSVSYTLDAKDGKIVTQEALTQISPEDWADLQFQFHPSVISQVFHWDTPQLWQEIEQEKPPRQPVRQETPIRWIFWRKGIRSLFQSCSPIEKIMFEAVLANKTFAEICEDLMDHLDEETIPMTVAQTLFKWISEEMISEMQLIQVT